MNIRQLSENEMAVFMEIPLRDKGAGNSMSTAIFGEIGTCEKTL